MTTVPPPVIGYVPLASNTSRQDNFARPDWAMHLKDSRAVADRIADACDAFGVNTCLIHNYPGTSQEHGMCLEQPLIVNASDNEAMKWVVSDQQVAAFCNQLWTRRIFPRVYLGCVWETSGPSNFIKWNRITPAEREDLFEQILTPWMESAAHLVFDATGGRAPGSIAEHLYVWMVQQGFHPSNMGVEHWTLPGSFSESPFYRNRVHQYITTPLLSQWRQPGFPTPSQISTGPRCVMVEDFLDPAVADMFAAIRAGQTVCVPLDAEHPANLPLGMTAAQIVQRANQTASGSPIPSMAGD